MDITLDQYRELMRLHVITDLRSIFVLYRAELYVIDNRPEYDAFIAARMLEAPERRECIALAVEAYENADKIECALSMLN